MSKTADRELALRHLADLCAKDMLECTASSSESLSSLTLSLSCELSDADHAERPRSIPSSPGGSFIGSPLVVRAPLVRPTEIKRRNRKRQAPGETQTDLRRLAKRAKARLNAQQRLQAVLGAAMYCHACGTTETPEWRRGPDGNKSLCNACGLHYAKIVRCERERAERERQEGARLQSTSRISVTALLN